MTGYNFYEDEKKLYYAKQVLRIDNDFNDEIIAPLVNAIPGYIETTTGMTVEQQETEPLANTVGGFLLQLWYNAEGADAQQLTRTIDSLLKTLSLMVTTDFNTGNSHGE